MSKIKVKLTEKSDPMVCFCYRQTVGSLISAHKQYGTLKALQKATNVGNGCGGCRASLCSLFQENVEDINKVDSAVSQGSTCVKPGQRLMSGFILADGKLEFRVISCNSVAPQLGECDSTTTYGYVVLDYKAQGIIKGEKIVPTGHSFVFDSRNYDLPRPFFGTFVLLLGRQNFGSSRFNIQWTNGNGMASTHENLETGRPRVYIPIFINKDNIDGPNNIYLGISNPRSRRLYYSIVVFDKNSDIKTCFSAQLGDFQSTWIDATEVLIRPLLRLYPNGNFGVKIESVDLESIDAATVYFFLHNRIKDFWSCQHL